MRRNKKQLGGFAPGIRALRGRVGRRAVPRRRSAFTRAEAILVGVVLLVFAAMIVPRFSEATQDSRLSGLISNLETVRDQIEIYRLQHEGAYPSLADFIAQMTTYTNAAGETSAKKSIGFPFGPQLSRIPVNPYTAGDDVTDLPSDPLRAWYYDEQTGEFRTNDGVHDYL